MRKSSDEVRINPKNEEDFEENGETAFNIKFDMDETHGISEDQRMEILEVLLEGSRKKDKESDNGPLDEYPQIDLQGSTRVIILAVGTALGAFIFFLVSML